MEKLQPLEITAYLREKDMEIRDEFGLTGEFKVSTKDIYDMLLYFMERRKCVFGEGNCTMPVGILAAIIASTCI